MPVAHTSFTALSYLSIINYLFHVVIRNDGEWRIIGDYVRIKSYRVILWILGDNRTIKCIYMRVRVSPSESGKYKLPFANSVRGKCSRWLRRVFASRVRIVVKGSRCAVQIRLSFACTALLHVVSRPIRGGLVLRAESSYVARSSRISRMVGRGRVIFPEGHVDEGEAAPGEHGGAVLALVAGFMGPGVRVMLLRLEREHSFQG